MCVQSIPSTLTPDDFSLLLLAYLNTCSSSSKVKVLAVLQAMHSQELLKNKDQLYQGFMDLLPKCVRPHMVLYVQNQDCCINWHFNECVKCFSSMFVSVTTA